MTKPYYITTAIYYVNDVPHLGHALEIIGADVQARYQRLIGREVRFLTGLDEHGEKVAAKAAAAGKDPQAWCDELSTRFKDAFAALLISNDDFIRTTEARHAAAVQKLWRALRDSGDIYLGKYEGWYDVKEECYITEAEMKDKGLGPQDARIKRMSEDAYFFRLSRYRQQLIELHEANPEMAAPPTRRNEVLNSFLKQEMPDLCISRSTFTWGIPVPDEPGHVVYVWFDALINYISAAGYGNDEAQFDRFWPAEVHVIGKDITKFHCVWWPAFLIAAGIPLPRQVFAHGFINVIRRGEEEAEKMSKSAGNVVDPLDYVEMIGAEALRYLILREVNYGTDGTFNEESMADRYNAELPNGIGNTLSRVLGPLAKNFEGGHVSFPKEHELTDIEREFGSQWNALVADYERMMPRFEFQEALQRINQFVDLLNRRINELEPWKLVKQDQTRDRARVFLTCVAEGLRGVAVLLQPFMPETSKRMLEAIGVEASLPWETARQWGKSFTETTVTKPVPLFKKLET